MWYSLSCVIRKIVSNLLVVGLAGNLGSIYASRISTCLHRGVQEQFKTVENTLLLMNVPVQILFLMIVWLLDIGHLDFTFAFSLSYFIVSMICVSSDLFINYTFTDLSVDFYCSENG
jgi:solute carrier family 41